MRAIPSAALAAMAIQPFVFLGLYFPISLLTGRNLVLDEILVYAGFAALAAVPFVLFAGVPGFLLLRRFNHVSWYWLATIGFVSAAVPVAFVGWSTDDAWLSYAQSAIYFGIHGLAGATAAFLVWSRSSRSR